MQYNLWWIGSEFQSQFFVWVCVFGKGLYFSVNLNHESAEIAQLGERQTENANVPG